MILFGIIFLTGLLNAINPRFMWKKFDYWKAIRGGNKEPTKEPTKSFFFKRRVSGIITMLVIALLISFPYIVMNSE